MGYFNPRSFSDPGEYVSVTPSDSTIHSNIRALYVGATAGNLAVDFGNGTVTIPVDAYTLHPMLGVQKVLSTGTTATPIFKVI